MKPETRVGAPGRHGAIWRQLGRTLTGRLTLAFVLLSLLSMLAVFFVWRTYRASMFEHAWSDVVVTQIRTVGALADAYGGDMAQLQRQLAASGLEVRIDGDPPASAGAQPRVIRRIEERVGDALGQPVRIGGNFLALRSIWVEFSRNDHRYLLVFPMLQWEANVPPPQLAWIALIVILTPACAALAVFWVQRPLEKLAQAIAGQRGHPARVALPAHASQEVKTLAAAYNQMAEELARRDREREHILSGVSHDLKSPLARLRMRVSDIEDTALADGVVRDVAALDRIAEQFLAFVRSAEPARRDEEVCRPGAVARNVAQGYRPEIAVRGDAPQIDCSAVSLERMLSNLLDNAVEYGAAPIAVHLAEEDGWARIAVVDQGPGIAEADIEQAMQPFVRLDPARGASGHCGLGLAIVSRLAEGAGGRWFAGRSAQGFAIGVLLPLSQNPAQHPAA